MMRQYELVERVTRYNPQADEGLLNKAYVYAMQKHGSQRRANGDPYFSHPLEVAVILTEETLEIDAPLAGRMGMQDMREELEELDFAVVNPEAHKAVTDRLAEIRVR